MSWTLRIMVVSLLMALNLDGLGLAQNAGNPVVHRDIEYANVNGVSLKLDLYVPLNPARPVPLVLWIHGGAWQTGSKEIPATLAPLASLNIAVASINYRLSQRAIFPAQIYDCKAAVRWLRAHAAEYRLDPDRIGVMGASAGGHLAALLGTTADDPVLEGNEGNPGVSSRVQAVCDFFGPSDLLTLLQGADAPTDRVNAVAALLGGPVGEKMDLARLASPVYHVSSQAAPFYIAHGENDHTVPLQQSIELNDALKKAGVVTSLNIVKGAGHGFHDQAAYADGFAFMLQQLQRP